MLKFLFPPLLSFKIVSLPFLESDLFLLAFPCEVNWKKNSVINFVLKPQKNLYGETFLTEPSKLTFSCLLDHHKGFERRNCVKGK